MRKLILAVTAAAFAFATPAFAASGTPDRIQLAQADVKVKIGEGRHDRGRHEGWRHRDVKRVVVHHDRGRHEGWRHSRHGGKTVIIKKGHGQTVVIKKRHEG